MYSCKCGKTFDQKRSLTSHGGYCNFYEKEIKKSPYQKDNYYECECGKRFEKSQSLNSHFSRCTIHKDGKNITSNRGGGGWNKGLTKEIDESLRKMSESLKRIPRKKWTEEQKQQMSIKTKGKNGGYREGTNKWRGSYSIESSGKKVWLDSSYEARLVEVLNRFEIKWKKNYKAFPYSFEGIQKKYIPDFYLEDLNVWIETKGWEKERDKFKWEAFPYSLTIIRLIDLNKIEQIENLKDLITELRPGGGMGYAQR